MNLIYFLRNIRFFFFHLVRFNRTESSANEKLTEGLQYLLHNYDSRIRPNYTGKPGILLFDFF